MNELETLQEQFKEHAKDDERHFAEIRESIERVEKKVDALAMALAPLTDAYNGILFSKKFLVGVSAFVIAIAAIGGAVMWVINHSIQR